MSISFWVFGHTSFIATTLGLSIIGIVIVILRKDLLLSSFINGALMVIFSLPIYYFLILTSPGIIERTYLFNHLTKITITGIPLEDIIFYFLVGFVVAPLYEYWQCVGLRKMPSAHKKFRKNNL